MPINLMNNTEVPTEKFQKYIEEAFSLTLNLQDAIFATDFGFLRKDIYADVTLLEMANMQSLNAEQRGVDAATDVLSFPAFVMHEGELTEKLDPALFPEWQDDGIFLGDIVLCPERARVQAEEIGHSWEHEMFFLTVHSTLHLLGYDHIKTADEENMTLKQRQIIEKAQDLHIL